MESGLSALEFSRSWVVLIKNGYQGIYDIILGIIPKNNPNYGELTIAEIDYKQSVPLDMVTFRELFWPDVLFVDTNFRKVEVVGDIS